VVSSPVDAPGYEAEGFLFYLEAARRDVVFG